MTLMLATWGTQRPSTTVRVPDVATAKVLVTNLDDGVTWALFEKNQSRWRVRRAGRKTIDSAGCFGK
jgi:hypothetical protein